MTNRVTSQDLILTDELVIEALRKEIITITSGAGSLLKGQVMGKVYATDKYNVYNGSETNGTEEPTRILLEDADASASEVKALALVVGRVNKFKLLGVDQVLSTDEISTPDDPVTELVAGGTLTATTLHTYKLEANNSDGHTTQTTTDGETTAAATAGTLTSQYSYAAIANINAILGDCSSVNKRLVLTVDGSLFTLTFNADYSGAGAYADFAAFIAAVDAFFTGSEATSTVSAGTEIVLTSATTGASSNVKIVTDETGLFGTATEVDGVAAKRTINVTASLPAGATGIKVWRTTDAGTTWKYRSMTAAELTAELLVDDGTGTWTTGTPVSANDGACFSKLERNSIYPESKETGYIQE